MKISVVISTYNGKKYIQEQLDSIKNQTLPADEVIISDDCSTDDTYDLIAMFIQENRLENNWKLIKNKMNIGWKNNFHNLLYLASGDIIFLCDQDDIWDRFKIKEMISIMNTHKKINCLAGSFRPLFMDSGFLKLSSFYKEQMIDDKKLGKVGFNKKTLHLRAEGCTMCVRKSFLDEISEYWFDGLAHDEFIWKFAVSTGGMYRFNSCNMQRRIHSLNASRQGMHTKEKRIAHLKMELKNYQKIEELFNKNENYSDKKIIRKMIKMTELRIELINKKKLWNVIPLTLLYPTYYQNKRSLITESIIALRA